MNRRKLFGLLPLIPCAALASEEKPAKGQLIAEIKLDSDEVARKLIPDLERLVREERYRIEP